MTQGVCGLVLSWGSRATASIDYRHLVDKHLALSGHNFKMGP